MRDGHTDHHRGKPLEALKVAPGKIGVLQQNSIFTFTLDSFSITNTRSLHMDTDFVGISVAVGSNPPQTLPTKSMGDLNNGTYTVNLSIPGVEVAPNEVVAFVYSIVNTGFAQNTVEQKLSAALASAATGGVTEGSTALGTLVGGAVGGVIMSKIGSLSGAWLGEKLAGFVFANCDGPVAGATHAYTGEQLAHQTANGKVFTMVDDNKGTDSADGCGSNSRYSVKWSVSGRPKLVPILATQEAGHLSVPQKVV